ncbi:39S ribosomal protein L32, mitochondrial [Lampris incognitus]|uniref:39S ribosomal protein L32, mitochondrial n=1 Tax=Lampris incognitus TaxID=2546036 RepID=UPI0024B52AAA|nr:39S ribosomal protein L32, mitochondrial [Lampris incognitus]
MQAQKMFSLVDFLHGFRRVLPQVERRLLQVAGLDGPLAPAPALALNGPGFLPQHQFDEEYPEGEQQSPEQPSGMLDGILWMAAPKNRRTIEVNRTRRRSQNKLLKVKTNIEPCPECGHLKQKHILCGFCFEKVQRETAIIRVQMKAMESGPLRAPATETVVLYEGETPSEHDKDKRIVERARKRPKWFS